MESGIASIGLSPAIAPAFFPHQWSSKAPTRAAGVRLKAKKKSDGFWEPKEIILDKDDIAKLQFSRMVGESREKSIAKIVAKKLNPHATNLEIEKMIKRRGVKAFMDMVSETWQEQIEQGKPNVGEAQKPTKVETTKRRPDPIPLAPKPGVSQAAAAAAAGVEFSLHRANVEWSQKADLSKENFKRLLDGKALFDKDAAVPLAPKPGTPERLNSSGIFSRALTPGDLSNGQLWELIGETSQPRKPRAPKAAPEKSTPELQARPSRGKQDLVSPEKRTKKQLGVPSLNSKPEPRLPKEPEGPKRVEATDKALEPEEVGGRSFEEVVNNEEKTPTASLPTLNKPTKRDAIEGSMDVSEKPLQASTEPADLLERPAIFSNDGEDAGPDTGSAEQTANRQEIPTPAPKDEMGTLEKQSQTPLPALNKPKLFARRDSNDSEKPMTLELSRPDLSSRKEEMDSVATERVSNNSDQAVSNTETSRKGKPQYFPGRASEEELDKTWALAEIALATKETQEVLFLGNNVGGMIARFGCLNGFLPGKELGESRGLKTFRSWARDKGHDVNHSSIWDSSESSDATFATSKVAAHGVTGEPERKEAAMHPDCESVLHKAYSQERSAVLSSFVGEKAKVVVIYVDRDRKKLVFSEKRATDEDSEVAQRRKELIAKLRVGDVVTVMVRNISLFGVFVELLPEGVSALINFGELSWSPVSDPSTLVQSGQEIQAKVIQLDHSRQRIYLSLKRMFPDPLLESLESLLDRKGEFASTYAENAEEAPNSPELDSLLQKLEGRQDVEAVSRCRYLHGAAVVPNFQVYLSSADVSGGHKLLARFGNEVQEIIVRTSVDREAMKSIILEATEQA